MCELRAKTPAALEACRTTYLKCSYAHCGSGATEAVEEANVQDATMACISYCKNKSDMCELRANSPAALEACKTTYLKCSYAHCGSRSEMTVEEPFAQQSMTCIKACEKKQELCVEKAMNPTALEACRLVSVNCRYAHCK